MFLRTGLERRWATRLIIDLVFIARFYVIFSYISAQGIRNFAFSRLAKFFWARKYPERIQTRKAVL